MAINKKAVVDAIFRGAGSVAKTFIPPGELGSAQDIKDRPYDPAAAKQLLAEAGAAQVNVSLATIYNTLHQFRSAGLLREVAVEASRSYFDTDTSDHHHFYLEDEQRVIDIPASAIVIQNLPEPPQGMTVTHVDVVVRVRKGA